MAAFVLVARMRSWLCAGMDLCAHLQASLCAPHIYAHVFVCRRVRMRAHTRVPARASTHLRTPVCG